MKLNEPNNDNNSNNNSNRNNNNKHNNNNCNIVWTISFPLYQSPCVQITESTNGLINQSISNMHQCSHFDIPTRA
ncbi:unnamed protein product [Schistosoma curassoni]|uniref:Uncharacterized protein n=1 Tax=Schistosoma curassoni TaxID=6186 RepID=A0A183L2J2_9TREM|nr:unnamed protein product [Schistosoma curassoni]